jgi:hypothetical protein
MNNQNIISNKFDSNWSTWFSYKSVVKMTPEYHQWVITLSVLILSGIIMTAIRVNVVAPSKLN